MELKWYTGKSFTTPSTVTKATFGTSEPQSIRMPHSELQSLNTWQIIKGSAPYGQTGANSPNKCVFVK
jgi:hypothetical protein